MNAPELAALLKSHGVVVPLPIPLPGDPSIHSFRVKVGAKNAVRAWFRLRKLTDEIGYYPVVCADEHGTLFENLADAEPSIGEELALANTIQPTEWMLSREQEEPEHYGQLELGVWEESPQEELSWTVPFDLSGRNRPLDCVWIAMLPTKAPWEALAYLRYGGWNECPFPREHVALHHDWHQRFGAEVVCVSGDIVEMHVARPPQDKETSVQLAREQFLYTGGDLIFQGLGDLHSLAAQLLRREQWFFWWD